MKLSNFALMVIACVSLGSSWSQAQDGALSVPINNWSYYRHASTFEEGFLRGTAAVINAAGQKNYLDSVAYVNQQEAVRRRLENGSLYVRTYFENKELNRQYRERYKPVPPTKEQWDRITAATLPDRLSSEQFDPTTGQLVWPHILRMEEYRVIRERIDALMTQRTPDNSGDGSPVQRELAQLIDGMKLLMKANIDKVSASQYAAAKWFLISLDYEAQQPLPAGV